MKVGRITISDRASAGSYPDRSGPEIEAALGELLGPEAMFEVRVVPDELTRIQEALLELVDHCHCALVVTAGGTGLSPRDVTPEATRLVLDKELPGFAEVMRLESFKTVPTAPLSRSLAGVRRGSLILNLPGNPRAIRQCLAPLGPAIREALRHLAGDWSHP